MEKQKRERNSNFTKKETNILISLVRAKKHIIENKKNDSKTWQEKELTWKAIEKAYNRLTGSVFRNHRHLKLKYEAMKRDTRRKAAMVADDGESPPKLTSAEKIVKQIILPPDEGNESQMDSDIPLTSDSDNLSDADDKWEWNLIPIKSENENENGPLLSKPPEKSSEKGSEKSSSDQLAEEKLEIVKIQKKIKTEELEHKFIQRQLLEKELEHKQLMYELEKQHVLLKIELIKKEFAQI